MDQPLEHIVVDNIDGDTIPSEQSRCARCDLYSSALTWRSSTLCSTVAHFRPHRPRLLQRAFHREGYVCAVNQTTQRRTEHLWLTKEGVEEERESELVAKSTLVHAQAAHEEHEATRLSAEEAAAAAATRVCLRQLTVGRLRRCLGGEPWGPARSQPMLCTIPLQYELAGDTSQPRTSAHPLARDMSCPSRLAFDKPAFRRAR